MTETPLENSLHLSDSLRTLAGEKEIADLEAIMSNVPQHSDQFASRLGTIRDATLVLANSLLANTATTQQRAAAISKLREFYVMAREACATTA